MIEKLSKEGQQLVQEYIKSHAMKPKYGSGAAFQYIMGPFDKIIDNKPFTILDFGGGKASHLHTRVDQLNGRTFFEKYPKCTRYTVYDPAIPGKDELPNSQYKFDYVFCLDVLEHVYLQDVPTVISTIGEYTNFDSVVFISLPTQPSKHTLSDGRNEHVNLISRFEWINLLKSLPNYVLVFHYLDHDTGGTRVFGAVKFDKNMLSLYKFLNT